MGYIYMQELIYAANFYLVMTVWLVRHFQKMKNTSV